MQKSDSDELSLFDFIVAVATDKLSTNLCLSPQHYPVDHHPNYQPRDKYPKARQIYENKPREQAANHQRTGNQTKVSYPLWEYIAADGRYRPKHYRKANPANKNIIESMIKRTVIVEQ